MGNGYDNNVMAGLNKNTTISIGLLVLILMVAGFFFNIRAMAQQNASNHNNHVNSPTLHQHIIDRLETNYIPRGELDQRLMNIEEKLDVLIRK